MSLRLLFLLELWSPLLLPLGLWSLLLPVFLLKFRFLLLLSLLLLFPLRQQFPLRLLSPPELLRFRPHPVLVQGHFIQGLLAEIFHCGLKSLAVHLRKCLAVSILQGYALQLGNLKDNQLVLHIILH